MSSTKYFTDDFKAAPYWWDALPPRIAELADIPSTADVVVVGAGLTGTSAATTLARGGRDVVILEQEHPGYGASTRNAGFVGRHFKHSLTELLKKFDQPTALSYFHELQRIFDFTVDMIKSEGLNCGLQENGRFIAAMNQPDFDTLKAEYALRDRLLNEEFSVVENGGATEYRSPRVVGGILLREQAAIHPGLYANAMAQRARSAGAKIISTTPMLGLRRSGEKFVVSTPRGEIVCKDVLIATNGYSGDAVKWVKRRLIPIRSYIVATEPLPKNLLEELLPHNRTYTDRRQASNYLRLSTDGTRIVFGGQTGAEWESQPELSGLKVREEMVGIFPQLADVKLSHSWSGRCAGTIDLIPKLGMKNGVHFALAYCFSGNALAPYLGHHAALRILGEPKQEIAFEARSFHAIPFYNGNPWFLPLVKKYYEWADRRR